jgi:hypothetical protein
MPHRHNAKPTLIAISDRKHLKLRFYFYLFEPIIEIVHSSNLAARKEFKMFSWTFDALTGFKPRRARAPAVASRPAVRTPEATPDPHLTRMRSEALRRLFPKLSSWFGSRRDALFIGEIHEYLSQAQNVTDLEQRIRIIERQRHFS